MVKADWVSGDLYFWSLNDTETKKEVARYRETLEPQLVSSGLYDLTYRLKEHATSNSLLGQIEVKESQMNEFPLNTGVKLVPPEGMEPPYQVMFIELKNGKAVRSVRLSESFGPLLLKPGTYRITYRQKQHGSSTITLVDSFELPAGNLVEIEL